MKYHVFLARRTQLTFICSRDTFEHACVVAQARFVKDSSEWKDAVVVYEDDGSSWWRYCGGVAEIRNKSQWIDAKGKHYMQREALRPDIVLDRPVVVSGYDPRNPPRDAH